MDEQIRHLQADAEYYFAEGCFINELSNTAQDPAVSIARARVAPGVTTRWHRLRDTIEREFALIEPSTRFATAFWGGGTPGLLNARDLERLGRLQVDRFGVPVVVLIGGVLHLSAGHCADQQRGLEPPALERAGDRRKGHALDPARMSATRSLRQRPSASTPRC